MAEFVHSPETVVKPGEKIPVETDYISRSAAVLALLDKGQKSKRYHFGDIWELNFKEIRKAIAAIPAADVRPVVRSKWIKMRFFPDWECERCCSVVSGNTPDPWNHYHFCPNCGAMMEES